MEEKRVKKAFSKVKQDILKLSSSQDSVSSEVREIKRLLESLNENLAARKMSNIGDYKDLSVPGRLCLFGEHSDWAGGHRRQNDELEKGYTIVAPTNQRTFAKIRELEEPVFRFKSSLSEEIFEVPLEEQKLLKIAKEGGLFSYAAGTVYEIISSYKNIKDIGIEIDNYKTDLPIKKGLSSSASVCVLTARSFDKIFRMNLTKKREMELAYFGENNTPSRCGKMDQACAYESPVLMVFDGDKIKIKELSVGLNLHFLIVDLKKGKDTVKILKKLSEGFPFPNKKNKLEAQKIEYFNLNKENVIDARNAISSGDAKKVGELMNEAQKNFDKYLAPSCPEELTAPKLHQVLNYRPIKNLVYGGKGVGSQGEGTAQLICRSKVDREKAKKILEKDLDVDCMELDLEEN